MLSHYRLAFRGITRSIFKRLRKKAAQNGIPVNSQAGEAVKDGITIGWNYDPDAELLEIECVRARFWMDSARVNRRLREEIESTLGPDARAETAGRQPTLHIATPLGGNPRSVTFWGHRRWAG